MEGRCRLFLKCLMLSFFVLLFLGDGFAVQASNNKALLICVDQFENRSFNKTMKRPALKNDISAMKAVLGQAGYDTVVLDTDSGKEKLPTKANILMALEDVQRDTLHHQTLLVFFTGHGQGRYLLPYDFNPSYEKTFGLDVKTITELVEKSGAGHKFLFLDACHSGAALEAKGGKDYRLDQSRLEVDQEGFYIIASCQTEEQSYVDENEPEPISYFTKYLVRGLQGEADGYLEESSPNCRVELPELDRYLAEKVSAELREEMSAELKRKVNQRPFIKSIGSQNSVLVRLEGCEPKQEITPEIKQLIEEQVQRQLKRYGAKIGEKEISEPEYYTKAKSKFDKLLLAYKNKDVNLDAFEIDFVHEECLNSGSFAKVSRGLTILFSYYYLLRLDFLGLSYDAFDYPINDSIYERYKYSESKEELKFKDMLLGMSSGQLIKYFGKYVDEINSGDIEDIYFLLRELKTNVIKLTARF